MRFQKGHCELYIVALYGLAVCAALTLQIRTTGLFFLRKRPCGIFLRRQAASCFYLRLFSPARLISRKAAGRAFADKKRKEPGREKKKAAV